MCTCMWKHIPEDPGLLWVLEGHSPPGPPALPDPPEDEMPVINTLFQLEQSNTDTADNTVLITHGLP